MGKDIQDYLDKGINGAPQLRPDEKRKFLGTYRERVVFVLTYDELTKDQYKAFCLEQIEHYPNGTILINANVNMTIQSQIMKLSQEQQVTFRLVDTNDLTPKPESIALVYTLDHAIDKEDIYLTMPIKKTSPELEKSVVNPVSEVPKAESFFKKLFKRK